MKIGNDPKKYKKPSDNQKNDQPGMTIRGKFIPYTWVVMAVGLLAVIVVLIVFSVLFNRNAETSPEETNEPKTEETKKSTDTTDPTTKETKPAEDDTKSEDVTDENRMWDEYIDEEASNDSESKDTEKTEDSDTNKTETSDTASDKERTQSDDDTIKKTIEQFFTAYQIYGPGTTSQSRYDNMLSYGSEDAANALIPTRGVDEAQASIDVTNKLVSIDIVPNEGVEDEYTVTLKYTSEVMGKVGQYTDVYTTRTDGSKVTEAIVRSMTTDN